MAAFLCAGRFDGYVRKGPKRSLRAFSLPGQKLCLRRARERRGDPLILRGLSVAWIEMSTACKTCGESKVAPPRRGRRGSRLRRPEQKKKDTTEVLHLIGKRSEPPGALPVRNKRNSRKLSCDGLRLFIL